MKYKVIIPVLRVHGKDTNTATREWMSIGEDMDFQKAKETRKQNRGSTIVPQR